MRKNEKITFSEVSFLLVLGCRMAVFWCKLDYNYFSVMRNKKNHSPYTIPSITGTMILEMKIHLCLL